MLRAMIKAKVSKKILVSKFEKTSTLPDVVYHQQAPSAAVETSGAEGEKTREREEKMTLSKSVVLRWRESRDRGKDCWPKRA